MLNFTVRRLLTAIPTLLILIALAFVLIRVAPGGPFDSERNAAAGNSNRICVRPYHLDEPLYQQFVRYLANLARGDFGPSFQYRDFTVTELIGAGFPVSLKLGGLAMLLALVVGVTVGSLAALRQNTRTDYTVMAVAMTGISIPNFVVAPLLILLFAVSLGWLPAGGLGDGQPQTPDPARHFAGTAADRVHCPAHARQHDRSAAQPVHSHGARAGIVDAEDHRAACAEARAAARRVHTSDRPRRLSSPGRSSSNRYSGFPGSGVILCKAR